MKTPFPPASLWNWTLDKNRIADFTGLPGDALHIHSGMLILVLAAIVLRRWPWHWGPWLAVLIAETANEAYNMLQPYYPSDEGNIRASLHDMWLTMLWPTVILVTFPLFARLWARARQVIGPSGDQRASEGADVRTDIVA